MLWVPQITPDLSLPYQTLQGYMRCFFLCIPMCPTHDVEIPRGGSGCACHTAQPFPAPFLPLPPPPHPLFISEASISLLHGIFFHFALPKSPDVPSFKMILTFYLFYLQVITVITYWLSTVCQGLSKAPTGILPFTPPNNPMRLVHPSDETQAPREPVTSQDHTAGRRSLQLQESSPRVFMAVLFHLLDRAPNSRNF